MELKDFPKELTQNRNAVECNFIFSCYKDPDFIDDYKNVENGKDILTEDGQMYFGIAQRMYAAGYRVFDSASIYEFLANKPELKDAFDTNGGFTTVKEITSLLTEENIDSYYDELVKSNMLLRLHQSGFNVMQNLGKFKNMTSEELYSFFDYKLNDICVGKVDRVQVEDLQSGYDDAIEEWDRGVNIGYQIGYPSLNYQLAGVHKKNLLLHLGHIGNGKTTTAILFYILPVIKSGENVCIISNEQSISEWRAMILASVLFNEIPGPHEGLNRQKLTFGHFTAGQKEQLKEAAKWLADQKGKLTFIEQNDYSITRVQKIIRKYANIGTGLFVFDTMKPEQEDSDKAWAQFSEVAKQLFMLSKKENVAIIATAQLAGESIGKSYLDLSCVGKSKAIAETATQVVMFRTVKDDEKSKLKVYSYRYDQSSPEAKKIKTILTLDPDREYIIVFVAKNRFGNTSPQIVYERNMNFNTLHEIGYVNVPYDSYQKR